MRRTWCLWALLAFPVLARAQSVEVTLDPPSITLDDTATLTVTLSGAFDDVRGPEMPDLQVVGRSSGTSVTVINGRMSQQQRIVLRIAPQRLGQLSIGPVQLLQRGRVVAESRRLTLRVLPRGSPLPPPPSGPAPSSPSPGGTTAEEPPADPGTEAPGEAGGRVPEGEAGKPAFLWVRTLERPVYLGEPIPVEYLLYVRSDWPLSALSMDQNPSLRGFVVEQAQADPQQVRRERPGRGPSYDVRTLWRGAVTPLQAGPAVLDPMRVTLTVGDLFSRRRVTIASDPVHLKVLPVPKDGRPADWVEGLVGTFGLRARVDRQVLQVGESALLVLEVTGSGNLAALKAPDIPLPESVRVSRVPSQDLDERVVDLAGVSGRRTFQFLLAPREPGEVEIPRIDLVFFNPLTGKFERSRTDPIRLRVTGGGDRPDAVARSGDPRLIFVDRFPDHPAREAPAAPGPAVPWGLLGLPVALWAGVEGWAWRRRSLARDPRAAVRRAALRKALRGLASLRGSDLPSADFWAALENVLRDFLGARMDLPPGLSPSEVARALADRGVPSALCTTVQQELEACAFGRFAPSAVQDGDRRAALGRVEQALKALDAGRSDRAGGRPG
ncbi:protein BatD [Myxococcota bacterium]|jgi:hypothetical protein|nr:protein BatD [Myxococcota bacterium]